MKLLPYIIPFVKDAAKAMKRICLEEFKEIMDDTLTELLGIAALVRAAAANSYATAANYQEKLKKVSQPCPELRTL